MPLQISIRDLNGRISAQLLRIAESSEKVDSIKHTVTLMAKPPKRIRYGSYPDHSSSKQIFEQSHGGNAQTDPESLGKLTWHLEIKPNKSNGIGKMKTSMVELST